MNDQLPKPAWRAILDDLGWTKADLGRRLGLHPNTADRWKDECPGPVLAYLEEQLFLRNVANQMETLVAIIRTHIAPRPKPRNNNNGG